MKFITFIKQNALTIILIILTLVLYARLVSVNKLVTKAQVEKIIEMDKKLELFKKEVVNTLILQDSVLNNRLLDLSEAQLKLSRQYEKINSDYSNITINRPKY